MDIRRSKLPDPKLIGNAGSFFKNPVITMSLYNVLIAKYPDMPSYPIDAESIKIPAGWLIEKSGMKGYTNGQIGVHKLQALVLVNYGGGNGSDIYQLALDLQQKVKEMFDISITPEVNLW
jgi:UDP-N-acetylmuramate dehydrogenase